MRRRKKNFRQWVAVPALASLGITLVAYGQNLMLEEVSLAAPAGPVAAAAGAAVPAARNPAPASAPAATGSAPAQGNPEFGGTVPGGTPQVQQVPGRIRSTSQDEMVRRARENSGREDPFVTLVLPQAVAIVPVAPPAPPPQPQVRTSMAVPPPVRIDQVTGRRQTFVGGRWVDEIIQYSADEPRWTVQGILNTGRESLVILEQDGMTYEAHIGEVLNDGAKVVAISGSQVTLLAHGRRYVKTIGGLEPQ